MARIEIDNELFPVTLYTTIEDSQKGSTIEAKVLSISADRVMRVERTGQPLHVRIIYNNNHGVEGQYFLSNVSNTGEFILRLNDPQTFVTF